MTDAKLSDNEVHDRLVAAYEALGEEDAATTRGQTAITAARRALALFQLGLLVAMEKADPIDALPSEPSADP